MKEGFCAYILLCELMFLLPGYIKRELYSVVRRDLVRYFDICKLSVIEAPGMSSTHPCLIQDLICRFISGYSNCLCWFEETVGIIDFRQDNEILGLKIRKKLP